MLKYILIIICPIVIMFSCRDGMTNTDSKSVLNVKVINSDGSAQPDAEVWVKSCDPSVEVARGMTDARGEFQVTLLEDLYDVYCSFIDNNSQKCELKYLGYMAIGGERSTVILQYEQKFGVCTFKIHRSYSRYIPVVNINVSLIRKKKGEVINESSGFDRIMQNCYSTEISNSQGVVTFGNVPIGYEFYILVYNNNQKWVFYSDYIQAYNCLVKELSFDY